jgi:hypothetical protein
VAISEPPAGPASYNRILTPLRGALRTADGWIAGQPHREAHLTAPLPGRHTREVLAEPG